MTRVTQRDTDIMAGSDIQATVAQHNAEIAALGGRMSGVETGLRTLQSEVHTGFAGINTLMHKLDTKIDRFDSRPQLNPHQMVQTVLSLAVLFTMVVAGIIYVAQAQFSGMIAKQESFNENVSKSLDDLGNRVGWAPSLKKAER